MGLNLRTMEEVELGVITLHKRVPSDSSNTKNVTSIQGERVTFTGKIPGWTRDSLFSWARAHGAVPKDNVLRSGTLLITGISAEKNTKAQIAKKYNIKTCNYKDINIAKHGSGRLGRTMKLK